MSRIHSSRTAVQHVTVLIAALWSTGVFSQDLIITGVIDGPLSGGVPKAVELYVVNDVADLSAYGLNAAFNGGNPGTQEFTFPVASASAGSFVYVASEAPGFTSFFGFAPDFTGGPTINGDDAIQLINAGAVTDVFGVVGTDGSGEPWEHLDGWAYRTSDSGPDGAIFDLGSWFFSGVNALDGETTNAGSTAPFPLGTYSNSGADTAPRVLATLPADGANNVAVDADIEITFSEPVNVVGSWFDVSCSVTGLNDGSAMSTNSTTYQITLTNDFEPGETCSVTVFAANVSDIDADDPPNNMAADFVFGFDVAQDFGTDIVINEILADPAGDLAGDANGDGVRDSSADEFVEIANNSGSDLDLSGWSVADAVQTRHTFSAGTVVADGCSIVVFGGGTPTGSFGGAVVQTASGGSLGFNNGGDTVTLLDAAANLVAEVPYGGEGGNDQSLTRDPDITGPFVLHETVSAASFSPGSQNDGSSFAGCDVTVPVVAINAVQGSGASSPLTGQQVIVEGVVTGDLQDDDPNIQNTIGGFYLQEESPDADPATSEGVFVFDGFSPSVDVNVGDRVRVTGNVTEFFGETQITPTNVEVTGSGSVAPTNVNLPAQDVILGADGEYIPDLERYEGMLVTFTDTLTVTDLFNLDRFGEVHLVAGSRPYQFTNNNEPDAAGFDAHLRDLGSRSIMLDDGLTVQNPDPIRYPPPGLPNNQGIIVRSGDTVSGLTGNIRFSRGSGGSGDQLYRVMPSVEPVFVSDNERPGRAPKVGGDLKVAGVNVLNFFTTLDQGGAVCGPSNLGCRGADNQAEFDRQLEKTVAGLVELDADIVGLVEIENNSVASLSSLVDALNAELGSGSYDFVDTGTIGGDAIKVGLIYQPATVEPLGEYAILDSTVDPNFIDTLNRPVLAQSFRDKNGEVFTVAVNHLKSKGSSCDSVGDVNTGDGQGNCNLTRTLAAQAQAAWLASDPTGSGDADILIIGDLNAYLREDPLDAFRDAGYENLLDGFVGDDAYSFIFDRQIGALDHALASPELVPQITGVAEWHINTDEADALDYNLDFGRNPSIFNRSDEYRSSDHDPILVGLSLSGSGGDQDADGDGVADGVDACPATAIPESVPTRRLLKRRYALVDGDVVFDTKGTSSVGFTTTDTAGCSCEQIIERSKLGRLRRAIQTRYGCSRSLMRRWVRTVNR